jgi:hypothetical protein
MWDVPVITDWTILANRPYTVLRGNKEKTCPLIDIAVPDNSNVNTKENEKLNKYKDLEIEVIRMWKVRTKIVPFIIRALGTIKKGSYQNRHLLPFYPSAMELQITLTSTAHSIRKVLGWIALISCWDLDLTGDRLLLTGENDFKIIIIIIIIIRK